jgi:uncharacterized membrane protein
LVWQFIPRVEWRVFITAGMLVAIDLVLDPAAVSLGFWKYVHPGYWGGVPYTNFLGWMLSGLLGCLILHALTQNEHRPNSDAYLWLLAGFLPALGTVILWFIAQ